MKLELKLISEELCLFIDENEIIMFFYVDDLIFAYRIDRKEATDALIARLKIMFEFREMREVKWQYCSLIREYVVFMDIWK